MADSADLDSAYATPSKATLAEMATAKSKVEAPRGGTRPDDAPPSAQTAAAGVPTLPPKPVPAAKRNIFASAAKDVVGGAAASGSGGGASGASGSGSGVSRLGATGADQLAAVIRAKTTLSKATRRLKQAGELRVKVLSARFTNPDAIVGAAGGAGGFQLRVQCDTDSQVARGESTLKTFDAEANAVSFNQRMSFRLPATDKTGELRMQLCDAGGVALCKSGLLLRAVLRAAPVTKEFPLFGPDLNETGHVRLSFEWAYDAPTYPSSP